MSPNVSRTHRNTMFSRSMASVLGLVQGGEFVTVRATEMVRGTFYNSTYRTITQPAARDVEGIKIFHS